MGMDTKQRHSHFWVKQPMLKATFSPHCPHMKWRIIWRLKSARLFLSYHHWRPAKFLPMRSKVFLGLFLLLTTTLVIRKWSCSPWGLSFTPPHPTQALIIKAAFAVGLHSCSSFHFNDVYSNHELFYIYIY